MNFDELRGKVEAGKQSFQNVNTGEVATKAGELRVAIMEAHQKVADAHAILSRLVDTAMEEIGAIALQNNGNAREGADLIIGATEGAQNERAISLRAAAITGRAATEAVSQTSGILVNQFPEVIESLGATSTRLESFVSQADTLDRYVGVQATAVDDTIAQADVYSQNL